MMFTPSHYYGPSLIDGTFIKDETGSLAGSYRVTIEWRGEGRPDHSVQSWAICMPCWVFGRDGKRCIEPSPSNRTNAWKRDHRFTFNEAQQIIMKHWEAWQQPLLDYFRPMFGENKEDENE